MTAARHALIVATGEFEDERLKPLRGPQQDAEALQAVLASAEIGGFEVEVAINSRLDSLRRTLEAFFADRARDDLLLVHFSGHGLKDDDGQLYLAASDTRIDRLLSTGLEANWLNRLISRSRSESIALFLDCCFAGAFATSIERRTGVDTAGVNETFRGTGRYVITASDAMQYSFEGGRQVGQPPEASPFTRAFVDGLLTGEADRNEDGDVSINELFDFLEERVRQISPSQTPTKSAVNQIGDWVIARSTRTPSIRLLSPELQDQLKSDNPIDRSLALEPLLRLVAGADERIKQAARRGLERLAEDDSRRLAEAARQYLAQLDGPAAPAAITDLKPPAPVTVLPDEPDRSTIDGPVAASASPAASRTATGDALWSTAPVATVTPPVASNIVARDIGPISVTRRPPRERPPGAAFSWRRSFARAAIGVFLGGLASYFTTSYYYLPSLPIVVGQGLVLALGVGLIVTVAERLMRLVRIQGLAGFEMIWRNRWVASATVGAIVGLAFVLVVRASVVWILWMPIGFLIGEALVGRLFARPSPNVEAPTA